MLKEHSWPSHNANLHNSISSSLSCNPVVEIGSVNHYPCVTGVDKTPNMEHSGTCRNMPEHEKTKIIFMKKKINDNNKIIFIKINNNVK